MKKNKIPSYLIDEEIFSNYLVDKNDWKKFDSLAYNLQLNPIKSDLLLKIKSNSFLVNTLFNVRYGIKTGNNKKYVKKDYQEKDLNKNWKLCLASATAIKRYKIQWQNDLLNYCEDLAGFSKNNFEVPKILIQYIRKLSLKRRLITAFDVEGKYYPLNNFSFIELKENSNQSLHFLIGILNSNLMNFYFENVYIDYNIKPKYIEKIPIRLNKEISIQIEELVDNILTSQDTLGSLTHKFQNYLIEMFNSEYLSRKLQNWHELEFGEFIKELNKAIKKTNKEREKEGFEPVKELTKKDEFEWMELFEENKQKAVALQQQIDETDRKIDQMVYELYDLTEEEIAIVENS